MHKVKFNEIQASFELFRRRYVGVSPSCCNEELHTLYCSLETSLKMKSHLVVTLKFVRFPSSWRQFVSGIHPESFTFPSAWLGFYDVRGRGSSCLTQVKASFLPPSPNIIMHHAYQLSAAQTGKNIPRLCPSFTTTELTRKLSHKLTPSAIFMRTQRKF